MHNDFVKNHLDRVGFIVKKGAIAFPPDGEIAGTHWRKVNGCSTRFSETVFKHGSANIKNPVESRNYFKIITGWQESCQVIR